jgi:hypothetical protein
MLTLRKRTSQRKAPSIHVLYHIQFAYLYQINYILVKEILAKFEQISNQDFVKHVTHAFTRAYGLYVEENRPKNFCRDNYFFHFFRSRNHFQRKKRVPSEN